MLQSNLYSSGLNISHRRKEFAMTGSLQIKNNKYYAVINLTDTNGKRKQKWIPTNLEIKGNKKKAAQILEDTLKEFEQRNSNYDDILFTDYLAEWLERIKHTLEPSTYAGYLGNIKGHIIPYFKDKHLKIYEVKPYHLEGFYAYLMSGEKPLSAQTVKHNHRVINKALNDAVRHEIIATNPAQRAVTPKVKKYVGSFLNTKQLQELFILFKETAIADVIMFIATYGLRRSEALGLCWEKVDFENGVFTISRAMIQHTDNGYYLKECVKNDSSYRTLPLTNDITKMLLSLKEKQEENKKFFGTSYISNDFVFVWEDGNPILPNYLTRTFHKIIKRSNLPQIRLHDLRHSTASNLLANGFSVVEVQHWLGHSQASTTLNFYSHIDGTSKQNIKFALEKMLPLEKC